MNKYENKTIGWISPTSKRTDTVKINDELIGFIDLTDKNVNALSYEVFKFDNGNFNVEATLDKNPNSDEYYLYKEGEKLGYIPITMFERYQKEYIKGCPIWEIPPELHSK